MTRLKTEISWVHLSDFHLRTDLKWSQDVVLHTLLKDLSDRYSRESSPDLLFITGDIAFSGAADEYLHAEAFVKELQAATSVSQEGLFIVPGNHDIARDKEPDAFRGASEILQNEVEVDKFFATEDRRETIFRRQMAFREFVNRVAPPENGGYSSTSFSHRKRIAIGPVNIAVLLLDSAWLAEGGIADAANLIIGERQILDTNITRDDVLSFALVHHPFAWLREFEQVPVENLILDRAHVVLRGHVHAADLRSVEALERRLTVFTAGATFENRTSDNSYNCTTVDLSTGLGTTTIYRYIHATKRWQPNAPMGWTLAHNIPPIAFEKSLAFLNDVGGQFVYYRAAMLAALHTLAPRIFNSQTVFLNLEVELPSDSNDIGNLVRRLRNLFFWRNAFDQEEWLAEAKTLASSLDAELEKFANTSADIFDRLRQQEEQCRHIANALDASGASESPVFNQLDELIENNQWEQILTVIARWEAVDFLTRSERRKMDRIAVKALLETNQIPDSEARLLSILRADDAEPLDFFLAASWYYKANDYSSANSYIRLALTHGIQKEGVKKLALLIAGKTGDKELKEMVL
jgi:predicted MPP superfamily phosphohydrolase